MLTKNRTRMGSEKWDNSVAAGVGAG